MENVYVFVAYVVALVTLMGCGLVKIGDILEQRRDKKYYLMIKDDAAWWQMKCEQTGMNIIDWHMNKETENDDVVEELTSFDDELNDLEQNGIDWEKKVEPMKEEFEQRMKDLKKQVDLAKEEFDEWLPF